MTQNEQFDIRSLSRCSCLVKLSDLATNKGECNLNQSLKDDSFVERVAKNNGETMAKSDLKIDHRCKQVIVCLSV